MTDRIVLANMVFQARHGVNDWEKAEPQRFEVDVELALDVRRRRPRGRPGRTVDYRGVYDITRQVVESATFNLIEALAEAIAHEVLARPELVQRGGGSGPEARGPPRRSRSTTPAWRSGACAAAGTAATGPPGTLGATGLRGGCPA